MRVSGSGDAFFTTVLPYIQRYSEAREIVKDRNEYERIREAIGQSLSSATCIKEQEELEQFEVLLSATEPLTSEKFEKLKEYLKNEKVAFEEALESDLEAEIFLENKAQHLVQMCDNFFARVPTREERETVKLHIKDDVLYKLLDGMHSTCNKIRKFYATQLHNLESQLDISESTSTNLSHLVLRQALSAEVIFYDMGLANLEGELRSYKRKLEDARFNIDRSQQHEACDTREARWVGEVAKMVREYKKAEDRMNEVLERSLRMAEDIQKRKHSVFQIAGKKLKIYEKLKKFLHETLKCIARVLFSKEVPIKMVSKKALIKMAETLKKRYYEEKMHYYQGKNAAKNPPSQAPVTELSNG